LPALHEQDSSEGKQHEFTPRTADWTTDTTTHVRTCPVCGWWSVIRHESTVASAGGGAGYRSESLGAFGSLLELDLADVEAPVEEVRRYLAARYESRFDIHPRLFEETVGSVFGDLGYAARVTGYSGDDGIDVILDGPAGEVIGVQVKRYRHSIQVEQIRALTGALVLGGLTRGIFVTTSTFQSGAASTVERLEPRGYGIELMDAHRFYEALRIAQRTRYRSKTQPDAPWRDASLAPYDSQSGYY
jgi:hypothetical protein